MSVDRTTPPQRVPVLTEVVQLAESDAVDIPIEPAQPVQPSQPPSPEWLARPAEAMPPPAPAAATVHAEPAANSPVPGVAEVRADDHLDEQLVEHVWNDLQRQVDLMLEYRLRETLAPILTRATEAVMRETRQQLASTLRDMVARAVAQELARHRGR